jgi:hypothetical protein
LVSFNQHKNPKKIIKNYNLYLNHFKKIDLNLQNNCDSWKIVYAEQKNDMEKMRKNLYLILTHPTILILNGTI